MTEPLTPITNQRIAGPPGAPEKMFKRSEQQLSQGFVPALTQRELELRLQAATTRRSVQDTPTPRMQRRNVDLRIAAAIDFDSDSD